ncbi:MAG: DUF3488 and transglutaminase-like domain-containing protein [Promethearchaeota archaeon]
MADKLPKRKSNIAFERMSLKKNAISGAILVATLMIAYFSFNPLLNALLGNARTRPQDDVNSIDQGTFDKVPIEPESFLLSLDVGNLPPELLAALILYMTDPSRLDPSFLDQFINNDALRTQSVFRAYDYDFAQTPKNDLFWRHATYDEYQGGQWVQSLTSTTSRSRGEMPTYADYTNWGVGPNYLVKMSADPSDSNDLQIPVVYPGPHVVGESIHTTPTDYIESLTSNEDAYNDMSLTLVFSGDAQPSNLTYRVFTSDQPDDDYLSSHAVAPGDIPQATKDALNIYYQFPDGKTNYYNAHPYFKARVDEIVNDHWLTDTTNMYQMAMDIARYMKTSGVFSEVVAELDHDRGDDMVETFCQTGQGTPLDWSAAFTMFCRYFDIPARWVSGYDSYLVTEEYDDEEGKNVLNYKYMNMYAWSEPAIYLDDNNYYWSTFDVPKMTDFPSAQRELDIVINGVPVPAVTSSPPRFQDTENIDLSAIYTRGGTPVSGETVTLTQVLPDGTTIDRGTATTDSYGVAAFPTMTVDGFSYPWVMGPHVFNVKVGTEVENGTFVFIDKAYSVNVDPSVISTWRPVDDAYPIINRTTTINSTFDFWGNVTDTSLNVNVTNAKVELRMYDQSPSQVDFLDADAGAYDNSDNPFMFTSSNGYFFNDVDIDDTAVPGKYNITARYTGEFDVTAQNPYVPGYQYSSIECSGYGTTESDRNDGPIYVNRADQFVHLYVNGENWDQDTVVDPTVFSTLTVYHYQGSVLQKGTYVEIYAMNPDGSFNKSIATGNTDPTTGEFSVSERFDYLPAGIQQIVAIAPAFGAENHSYIVVDAPMQVNPTLLPSSLGINKTVAPTTFDFHGVMYTPGVAGVLGAQMTLSLWGGDWNKPKGSTGLSMPTNDTVSEGKWRFDGIGYSGAGFGYWNVSVNATGIQTVPANFLANKTRGGGTVDLKSLGLDFSNVNTTMFDLPVDDPTQESVDLSVVVDGTHYFHDSMPDITVSVGQTLGFDIHYTKGLDKQIYISNVQFDLVLVSLNGTQTFLTPQTTNLWGDASWNLLPSTISSGSYLVHVNSTNSWVNGENFTIFTRTGETHFDVLDLVAPQPYMLRGNHPGFTAFANLVFDDSWKASKVNVQVRLYNGSTDYSSFYEGGASDAAKTTNGSGGIVFGEQKVQDNAGLVAQYYKLVFWFNGSFDTSGWSSYDDASTYVGSQLKTDFTIGTGSTWTNYTESAEQFLINDPEYYAYTDVNGIAAKVDKDGSNNYYAAYDTGTTPVSVSSGYDYLFFNVTAVRGIWHLQGTQVEVTDGDVSRSGFTDSGGKVTIGFNPSEISTWRVGPHFFTIRVNDGGWISVNYTVVLVNRTVTTFTATHSVSSLTRGVDSLTVTGTLSYSGLGTRWADVNVTIFTPDFKVVASGIVQTDSAGSYSVALSPGYSTVQGEYLVRADFNFTFYRVETNFHLDLNWLQDYGSGMNSSSSFAPNVNVTAEARVLNYPSFNPKNPIFNDNVVVTGTIQWRNASSSYNGIDFTTHPYLAQYVVVRVLDGSYSELYSETAADGGNSANADGTFQVNITWQWSGVFHIVVDFAPPQGVYNIEGQTGVEAQ